MEEKTSRIDDSHFGESEENTPSLLRLLKPNQMNRDIENIFQPVPRRRGPPRRSQPSKPVTSLKEARRDIRLKMKKAALKGLSPEKVKYFIRLITS